MDPDQLISDEASWSGTTLFSNDVIWIYCVNEKSVDPDQLASTKAS